MRLDPHASAQDGPDEAGPFAVRPAEPFVGSFAAPLRYTEGYFWLLVVAVLDICLTWTILHLGGKEINPVAGFAIELGGRAGIIGWKFLTILVFVCACEAVGRRADHIGQKLVLMALTISATPVVWALVLLARY